MKHAVSGFSIALAIALCSCILTACTNDSASIELTGMTKKNASITVDSGSGSQDWDGKPLPAAPVGTVVLYKVRISFSSEKAYPSGGSLIIGPTAFPYSISLNGYLLSAYGEAEDVQRVRKFNSEAVTIDPALLSKANVLEMKMHVGSEPAPVPLLMLTDTRSAASYVFWRNFFMTQLVSGGFAVGILLFVYFSAMSIIGRAKDKRFLWFAGLCGFFALAYVNMVFNHEALSDTFLTKISRVGFFLCAPMLTFYVMETTQILHRKNWIKWLELLSFILCSAWVLIQKDFVSTNAAFHLSIQIIITPNLVLSLVLLVFGILRHGLKRYAILLTGMAGVLSASFYDMFYESSSLIPYAWLLSYGYLWLVICVFLELALNQEKLSVQAIQQAKDLGYKNEVLEQVFEKLRSGSDVLTSSTEDLAVSTREASVSGNQQAAAVREIVSTMEDAEELLNRISQKSSVVRKESTATAQKAEDGVSHVREALKRLEAVIGRINESIELMTSLGDQMGSITEIVKLIESIATQIRIIAFNASLEAVAAGDAGRNFMIVADEVKRLSDSTMASVKNIRSKVSGIINTADSMVQVARQDYMALEQSWDLASGIGETLSGITQEANSSAMATADIDTSLAEESSAFRQIVQTLKEISSGVNNFVDAAVHTSVTTARINDIAEELSDLIKRYSVDNANHNKSD